MFQKRTKGLNCYAMTPLVDQVDLQPPWPCFHGRPLTCSVASLLALVNLAGVDNAVVCLGWRLVHVSCRPQRVHAQSVKVLQ